MTTVLFIRHGRTDANARGVLAGWSPGVHLDDHGRKQAEALAAHLAPVRLAAIVASPLERTVETAEVIAAAQRGEDLLTTDDRLGECRYGDWTGGELSALAKEPLWRIVQSHPSAARFPGAEGESLTEMQARAVASVRSWNLELGPRAVYAVVSHGDVIKGLLADALGMHLDHFQRIQVDPCSVSLVTYSPQRPFVLRMNSRGADIADAIPSPRRRRRRSSDAAVGGGAG